MGYVETAPGRLDWALTFQRTGNFPLDRTDLFSSYADAVKYAKGDKADPDSRNLCGTSYVGQIITVFDDTSVTAYVIKSDRTLQALATSASTGNIESDLAGITSRVEALEAAIGEGGSVAEQIEAAVEAHKTEVNNKIGTKDDAIGTDTVYGEINGKADKATTLAGYGITDAYTKNEVDAKVSGAFHFKGKVDYLDKLPATGQAEGDVWQVVYTVNEAEYVSGETKVANAEYAWNGTEWVDFGSIIDLSAYAKTADVAPKVHTHTVSEVTDFAAGVTSAIEATGKGLSKEDFTTEFKTKLEGIEDGADVNIIETVKVNGEVVEVVDKAVNVTVPTGALASKDKVAESDLATELATKLNNKADKATTLAGYGIENAYTKTEVDDAVSTAKSEAITSAGTNADTKISTAIGTLTIDDQTYTTVKDYVDAKAAAAQSAATYDDTQVKADIQSNANAISAINNPDTGILKQSKDYADSLAVNYDEKGAAKAVQGNTTATVESVETELASVKATADKAVVANAAITAGTHTKITYDAKGLVTGGSDLIVSDIPELPQSKITNLETDLASKQDNLVFEGSYSAATNKVATESTVKNAVDAEAAIARAAEQANATAISGLDTRMGTAEGKLTTLTGAANVTGSVAEAKAAADAAQASVDTLAGKVGTVPANTTVVDMIAAAQEAATYDDTQVKADIKSNADAIGVLNGSETTAGSVAKAVKDAKDAVIGTELDAKTADTVYGAKAFATDAINTAIDTLNGELKAVAKSGKASDVSIEDADNKITATTVEGALAELATNIENANNAGKVTITPSTSDSYAGIYTFTQNGATIGTINIPKDMVVESGTVVTLAAPDEAGHAKGTYIKLVIANATNDEIWVPVDSLIEYVTGGATAEITVSVDPTTHVATATINDKSIVIGKLSESVQASLGKADTAMQDVTILGKTLNQTTKEITVAEAKTALGLKSAAYVETTAFDQSGAAAQVKTEVIGTELDAKTADTVYGAKAFATDLNTAMNTRVEKLETSVGTISVPDQIKTAIEALDVTDTAVDGQYVSAVSETNGKISVTRKALPDYSETYDAKGAAAQALTDAKKYTDDEIDAFDATLKAIAKSGKASDVAIDDAENNYTSTTVEAALAEIVTKISTAKTEAIEAANAYTNTAMTWIEF